MSYPEIQTFWLDRTETVARALRRYSSSHRAPGAPFNCSNGYHNAAVWVDRVPATTHIDRDGTRILDEPPKFPADDPRWPRLCSYCQYVFTDDDPKQTFYEEVYRAADGREFTIHPETGPQEAPPAPPGAMWHAYWLPTVWRGEDGIALVVRLANGHDWIVDSVASNCDQRDRPHHCWVRHGDPRTEPVTVDKDGDTCGAGAGSILAGDYHGFLRAGVLTSG
jgi:hypothetical protein